MMAVEPGGIRAGGDAGEEKGQGVAGKAPASATSNSNQTLWSSLSCLCPSSESHPLEHSSRGKARMFSACVVCGRINQKIAAHQALGLELNPFKSVSLSSHPLII